MISFLRHLLLAEWICLILCHVFAICQKCWFSSFIRRKWGWNASRTLRAYGDASLCETTFHDWFLCFKQGDFDADDRLHEERSKTFQDSELDAFLDESPFRTQKKLALALGAVFKAIYKQLHALGMNQKQGTWAAHDLKLKEVERR